LFRHRMVDVFLFQKEYSSFFAEKIVLLHLVNNSINMPVRLFFDGS